MRRLVTFLAFPALALAGMATAAIASKQGPLNVLANGTTGTGTTGTGTTGTTGTVPGRGQAKVTVCHRTGGWGGDKRIEITIAEPALAAHLAHGDTVGPCETTTGTTSTAAVAPKANAAKKQAKANAKRPKQTRKANRRASRGARVGKAKSDAASTAKTKASGERMAERRRPAKKERTTGGGRPETAGKSATAPGKAGTAPGKSGDTPAQSRPAPGKSGDTPGKSQAAPGKSKAAPGKSGEQGAGKGKK